MGLFKKNPPPPVQTAPPPQRMSTSSTNGEKRGLFSRHRSRSISPDTSQTRSSTSSGGFFHRNQHDPSIVQAKQRVADAEAAERNADQALIQARAAVRDAREDIKRLEREAAEEARLAKIKQHEAAGISKSAKHLGRHDMR